MTIGIVAGLTAAFLQAISYLVTRRFVHQRHHDAGGPGRAGRKLLVLSHIQMGLFSVPFLLCIWPTQGLDISKIAEPLAQGTFFYLVGQSATTFALRYAEPSRLSPLLGFKIVVLAGLASFFIQPHAAESAAPAIGLSALQWAAVGLSVVAAVALNFSGAALRPRAITWILLACAAYSYADWNIARTNFAIHAGVPGSSLLHASLLSAGLCYVVAGTAATAFLPWFGSSRKQDWNGAVPFSMVWFMAMVFLYWCFSEVGPLFGNILQSTRGIMSILMAAVLIYRGHLHLEPANSRRVFMRRLAAGLLMFAAISLYVLGDSRYRTVQTQHPHSSDLPPTLPSRPS